MDQKVIDRYVLRDYQHHENIRHAWRRYEDCWDNSLTSRPDIDPRDEDNTPRNLVKQIVDKVAYFLLGRGFDVAVDDDGDSPEDDYAKGFLRQNGGKTTWLDIAKSGAVTGDVYVIFSAPERGQKYPRIRSIDAESVTILGDPIDYERIFGYVITSLVPNMTTGQHDHYQMVIEQDQETDRWTITESVKEGNFRSNAGARITSQVEWPFAWCPLQHSKNLPAPHSRYGTADLTPSLISMNAKVNFYWSNLSRILRLQGAAKPYALGVPTDFELDMSPATVFVTENSEAEFGVMKFDFDPATHLQVIEKATAEILDAAQVPPVAFGKMQDLGQLSSGRALEILYGALIDLTDVKRSLYGDLIERVVRCALDMGGYGYNTHEVKVNWPRMLPNVPKMSKDDVEAALGQAQLGVSKTTILAEFGYDYEQEAEKIAQEGTALGSGMIAAFNAGTLSM